MKTISKAYLSNQECSAQETVYHILPTYKQMEIFAVVFLLTQILHRDPWKYYFLKIAVDEQKIFRN